MAVAAWTSSPPRVREGDYLSVGPLTAALPPGLSEKIACLLGTMRDRRRTLPRVVCLAVQNAPVWVHLCRGLCGPFVPDSIMCACFLDAPWGGAAATAILRAQRDGDVTAADAGAMSICGERVAVGRAGPLPETSAELAKWFEWSPVFKWGEGDEDDV